MSKDDAREVTIRLEAEGDRVILKFFEPGEQEYVAKATLAPEEWRQMLTWLEDFAGYFDQKPDGRSMPIPEMKT